MSGTATTMPVLSAAEQARLDTERRRAAEREAAARAAAIERERLRRLEEQRQRVLVNLSSLTRRIEEHCEDFLPEDLPTLEQRCQNLRRSLLTAKDMVEMQEYSRDADQLAARMDESAQRQRDRLEQRRLNDVDQIRSYLHDCEWRLSQLATDGTRINPAGYESVAQALRLARPALESGDPESAEVRVCEASRLLREYQDFVDARRGKAKMRTDAELAMAAFAGLVAGLRADPTVMLWQHRLVSELEDKLDACASAISSEWFARPEALLSEARVVEQQIIRQAGEAQAKADERDCREAAFKRACEHFGLEISLARPEDPLHPATALLFRATLQETEGAISIAVPFEGPVRYEVSPYPETGQLPGPGSPGCQPAVAVLGKIHSYLDKECGLEVPPPTWAAGSAPPAPKSRSAVQAKPQNRSARREKPRPGASQ